MGKDLLAMGRSWIGRGVRYRAFLFSDYDILLGSE